MARINLLILFSILFSSFSLSLSGRLLEKRGLRYTSFDVFATNQDKPLDLSEDCSTLGCTEVRVEPRVLFR